MEVKVPLESVQALEPAKVEVVKLQEGDRVVIVLVYPPGAQPEERAMALQGVADLQQLLAAEGVRGACVALPPGYQLDVYKAAP